MTDKLLFILMILLTVIYLIKLYQALRILKSNTNDMMSNFINLNDEIMNKIIERDSIRRIIKGEITLDTECEVIYDLVISWCNTKHSTLTTSVSKENIIKLIENNIECHSDYHLPPIKINGDVEPPPIPSIDWSEIEQLKPVNNEVDITGELLL